MGHSPRGVPSQVQVGGTLPDQDGGTLLGCTLLGGYPGRVTPPSRVTPQARSGQGGTQLGQQKEYSLHGGRYASCVHAGGLSCLKICWLQIRMICAEYQEPLLPETGTEFPAPNQPDLDTLYFR